MKKIITVYVLSVFMFVSLYAEKARNVSAYDTELTLDTCGDVKEENTIIKRLCPLDGEDKENASEFLYFFFSNDGKTVEAIILSGSYEELIEAEKSDIEECCDYKLEIDKKNKKIIKVKGFWKGFLYEEFGIKNNFFHGEYTRWDRDGSLIGTATYNKGHRHGERALYYTSGEYKYQIPYTEGVIDGTIKRYNRDGEIREEVEVKNGKYSNGWAYRGGKKRKLNPAQKAKWEKMILEGRFN